VHEARSTATQPLVAGSGLGHDPDWQTALALALEGALGPLGGQPPDLLLLFASAAFAPSYPDLLAEAAERSGARELAGCSASGVIAGDRELEDQPAMAALALCLPAGASLGVRRVLPDELGDAEPPGAWPTRLGLRPSACTGLILLADPFSVDVLDVVAGLQRDYPGVPLVGGLATGAPGTRQTHVFCRQEATAGVVLIGLTGSVGVRPVVSQGCEPIGAPWTITDVDGYLVRRIGNRPAYEVLVETIGGLSPAERQRAAANLLVGLAMDEYRDQFGRGDFLIRNLLGVDRASGAIAIGAQPRVGQTLQFQVRDARAADAELRHMLGAVAGELSPPAAAALVFACNGRGAGLFGAPDHDARTTRELLGPLPLAGLFCNGEIGPVGGTTFLHGFTASLGLIAAVSVR
jgi:small ligand-binding sensory domain FIST